VGAVCLLLAAKTQLCLKTTGVLRRLISWKRKRKLSQLTRKRNNRRKKKGCRDLRSRVKFLKRKKLKREKRRLRFMK
jgi:hypothetical protein